MRLVEFGNRDGGTKEGSLLAVDGMRPEGRQPLAVILDQLRLSSIEVLNQHLVMHRVDHLSLLPDFLLIFYVQPLTFSKHFLKHVK